MEARSSKGQVLDHDDGCRVALTAALRNQAVENLAVDPGRSPVKVRKRTRAIDVSFLAALCGVRRGCAGYASSISDIAPPGGIIGITASSFGIATSIRTGPRVANASFIILARSLGLSILKPCAP